MTRRLTIALKRYALWLILASVALLVAWAPLPLGATTPTDRIVRLEARSFEYSPPVISVNQGDRVTLEIVSTDVVHGIYIDGYGLEVTADPGQTARLSFIADKAGSFRFRCSVTCGALHPFMIGQLKVGTNFLLWRSIGLALLALIAGIVLYNRPARRNG